MDEPVYVDGFAEEIGQEVAKLFGAAIRRHREVGGALDGTTLAKLRGAVREDLRERVPMILAEHLEGQRQLTASGDAEGELRRRFPAAFTRHIR